MSDAMDEAANDDQFEEDGGDEGNDGSEQELDSFWWLAAAGDTIIWARLSTFASGIAEVFDCDGNILRYPDEEAARVALLDAEFRAMDGLDQDDADQWGLDLDTLEPPMGDDLDALVPQMIEKNGRDGA
ncbi:MAG: hypothetical protein WBP11_09815 [Dokdonella sp.]